MSTTRLLISMLLMLSCMAAQAGPLATFSDDKIKTSVGDTVTVSVDPLTSTVTNGTSFSIDLVGLDFNNGDLDGGGINFSYDPAVVNVTSVTVDTTTWEFFSDNGVIDNGVGSVNGIQFNTFQSRTGDLTFATVQFVAVGTGVTGLGLSEYLANPFATGGSPYPGLAFAETASIAVAPIPLPGAALLFASALGIAGWFRRVRS